MNILNILIALLIIAPTVKAADTGKSAAGLSKAFANLQAAVNSPESDPSDSEDVLAAIDERVQDVEVVLNDLTDREVEDATKAMMAVQVKDIEAGNIQIDGSSFAKSLLLGYQGSLKTELRKIISSLLIDSDDVEKVEVVFNVSPVPNISVSEYDKNAYIATEMPIKLWNHIKYFLMMI